MHNNRHSIQVPCKFQINRFINNRAVDDPITRAVDYPSTRAVDDRGGQRRAAIAALRASITKSLADSSMVVTCTRVQFQYPLKKICDSLKDIVLKPVELVIVLTSIQRSMIKWNRSSYPPPPGAPCKYKAFKLDGYIKM